MKGVEATGANVNGADVDGCGTEDGGSRGVPARLRRHLAGVGPTPTALRVQYVPWCSGWLSGRLGRHPCQTGDRCYRDQYS